MAKLNPRLARQKRHVRVRAKVTGIAARPRLAVYRSLNHIYAQIIDDTSGKTVAAASSLEAEVKKQEGTKKTDTAKLVGKAIALRAREHEVGEVVFDRGGYQYHGRVKALADAAREAGLKF